MHHYIIACTDNAVRAYGPFDKEKFAAAWGRRELSDPRWNVVELEIDKDHAADGVMTIPVTLPDDATLI